jgi:hypothetical protein
MRIPPRAVFVLMSATEEAIQCTLSLSSFSFPCLDLFTIALLMYTILYHSGPVLVKMTVGIQVISFVEVKMIWLNLGLWIISNP